MNNTMSKYRGENGGVRISGPEDRRCPVTGGHEVNSCAGTGGHEVNSCAGTGGHEVNSCAGTGGPGNNNGGGTSGPEDSCGAGTSGSENSSNAGTSGPEDSCGAGNKASIQELVPPMSDTENWFMEKRIDGVANKYKFEPAKRGKWILCFAIDQMNEMWAKAYKLYTEGKLEGIQYIRTSTAKDVRPNGGAIRFYCGPYDDEERVKQYGQHVVSLLNYSRQFGFISFKTDEQTEKGARSTFLYRLKVPRTERGGQDECSDQHEIDFLKPMSIMDKEYVAETVLDNHDRYKCDWTQRGRWTMWCREDTLDDAWRESCTLYRQGKLTGVQSMGVMTGKQRPSEPKPIFFHCGPFSDRRLMMEYGRGIARQLGHYCSWTLMGYKVLEDETRASLSKELGEHTFLYRLNTRRELFLNNSKCNFDMQFSL